MGVGATTLEFFGVNFWETLGVDAHLALATLRK
jgi:hypothetical protein